MLPREESWSEACDACEREVGFHEGPQAARYYQFVARGIAEALQMVGLVRPIAMRRWWRGSGRSGCGLTLAAGSCGSRGTGRW